MSGDPYLVRWTDHALVKAGMLGFPRADVEEALLQHHHARQRNQGAAGWRVTVGRIVIVYDHPDQGDPSTARLVTLWRRR